MAFRYLRSLSLPLIAISGGTYLTNSSIINSPTYLLDENEKKTEIDDEFEKVTSDIKEKVKEPSHPLIHDLNLFRHKFNKKQKDKKFKKIPTEFLKKIPKADIHCHLDGSIRIETLIQLAMRNGIPLPTYNAEELRKNLFPDVYDSLEDYLRGFPYTVGVMRSAFALEKIAYELAKDCLEEGTYYLEVRFAPQLCASPDGLNIDQILRSVDSGLRRAKMEWNEKDDVVNGEIPPFEYGIIACALRAVTPALSPYYQSLCRVHEHEDGPRIYSLASTALVSSLIEVRKSGIPIVALDIAGPEAGFPASQHEEAYSIATKEFLSRTVHAGEAYGPTSIYQAITDLHANRIGHGYHIFSVQRCDERINNPEQYVQNLIKFIGEKRITLEVCLTSNQQTMPWLRDNLSAHNFGRMLREDIPVCINTDNRLMSNTNMVRELEKAIEAFPEEMTPRKLREVVLEGFRSSFFPGSYHQKKKYLDLIKRYYDKVAKEFGFELGEEK